MTHTAVTRAAALERDLHFLGLHSRQEQAEFLGITRFTLSRWLSIRHRDEPSPIAVRFVALAIQARTAGADLSAFLPPEPGGRSTGLAARVA